MKTRKPKVFIYQNLDDVKMLRVFLETNEFEVETVNGYGALSVAAAKQVLKKGDFDICVLDSPCNPDNPENPLMLLEYLRAFDTQTPAVFLSSLDNADYVSVVLDKGADDCMHRPYNYSELVSRLNAVLRRTGLKKRDVEAVYTLGALKFDTEQRTLTAQVEDLDGEMTDYCEKLPVKESKLLALLCVNMGKLVSKKELVKYIWNNEKANENMLNLYVYHLRQKLMIDPGVRLGNVHGLGYVLEIG